jgi:hypothetical protein
LSLEYGDRVLETTATAGTGTLTLLGPGTAYASFAAGVGVGNETDYLILDVAAGSWEIGRGTVSDATHLTRDTVWASSAGGGRVNFAPSVKTVLCTAPARELLTASRSVTRESPGGAVDGVNAAFLLSSAPAAGSEEVYLNGLLQGASGYSLSGALLTMVRPPLPGDEVLVSYRR